MKAIELEKAYNPKEFDGALQRSWKTGVERRGGPQDEGGNRRSEGDLPAHLPHPHQGRVDRGVPGAGRLCGACDEP